MTTDATVEAVARALFAVEAPLLFHCCVRPDWDLCRGCASVCADRAQAAICAHLTALTAAGYAVVPREPSPRTQRVARRVTIALHIGFPPGGDSAKLEIAGRAQQCLAKVMHDAYSDHGIDDLEIVVQHMGLSDEVAEDK